MNAGFARESFAPIGSNLPDYDNYFCRDCRRIVHVRKGSPAMPLRQVLPSPDDTSSDRAAPGAFANVGSARDSFAPIGSNRLFHSSRPLQR